MRGRGASAASGRESLRSVPPPPPFRTLVPLPFVPRPGSDSSLGGAACCATKWMEAHPSVGVGVGVGLLGQR